MFANKKITRPLSQVSPACGIYIRFPAAIPNQIHALIIDSIRQIFNLNILAIDPYFVAHNFGNSEHVFVIKQLIIQIK